MFKSNLGSPDLSEYGDIFEYGYGLGPDQPATSVIIKKQFLLTVNYHTIPPEDSTLASMLVQPGRRLAVGGAKFSGIGGEDVPRVYVKTMYDRVLKGEQQDSMIHRWTPSEVFVLETDHSPFFSAPIAPAVFLVKVGDIE